MQSSSKAARPSLSSTTTTPQPSGAPANVQEFAIRLPKNMKKNHHVMRFNGNLKVDFAEWKNVKMERENNMKDFRGMDEDTPKFGAGSEYNRDIREEVRRKKYGIAARKYKPEAQPWILKVGGSKTGKKFRGIREGGVGENAAFYVFTHAPDGAIEAYPLSEWYNFQPIQRYKALSAEEAEAEFGRRNKVMNYFSLMFRKRLKGDDDEAEDPEETKLKLPGAKKGQELKISEMDEWIDSDDDSNSSDEEDADGKKRKKGEDSDDDGKKKSKKKVVDKKKKRNVDEEAFEESDDGDEEGRECEYNTDSSEGDSDLDSKARKQMSSVAEEDALRKLLTSEEESEEEKKNEESEKDEEKNNKKEKETKDKKKKKLKKKKTDEKKESLSDFSSDSDSDSSLEEKPALGKLKKLKVNSGPNSRSGSPSLSILEGSSSSNPSKRKIMTSLPMDLGAGGNSNGGLSVGGSENSNSPNLTPAKKAKYDAPSLPVSFAGVVSGSKDDYGITEEAVRRYLLRKPMTTTELLTKFKNKRTGVSSEKLVETMTQILKKINPVKQTIQGKMYLSIKINK